jgi:leucyl aminopeptidase
MGMWTTELQDEMKTVVAELSNASQACYGNHSYAAGYLESVVVDLLRHAA